MITVEIFEHVAYEGFYRLARKLVDTGFSYLLAEHFEIINSSSTNNEHLLVVGMINALTERRMYKFDSQPSRQNFSKQLKLRALIVQGFHKAVGTRLRLLSQINVDAAESLAKMLSFEYGKIMASAKHASQFENLKGGRLYIFRHMDLTHKGEKATLPDFVKPILEDVFESQIIKANFKFVELAVFNSRIDAKLSKFNEDG